MDEFDKIREISEDLTHRREPVFTQLGQNTPTRVEQPTDPVNQFRPIAEPEQPSEQKSAPVNHPFIDSFLKTPFGTNPAESEPLKSPFADNESSEALFPEDRHFSTLKLPLIGLAVLAGIIGVVAAGFLIFNNESNDMGEIVTITAASTVIKESPEQAGGINIPDQDKLIYNRIRTDNVTTKVESLFPEPEKPVMPQILTIEDDSTAEEKFVTMAEVKAVDPLAETPAPIAPVTVTSQPEKPLIVPANKVEEKALPAENSVKSVVSTPKNAATEQLPLIRDVAKETPKSVTQPLEKGAWRVQLFASNNKSAVESAWKRILAKHTGLLSDMSYEIESATIAGKGQFYRLKVGQFSSREKAANLCAKLKAQKQDCMPAK